MCLEATLEKTKKMRKSMSKKHGKRMFYKVLDRRDGVLYSPYLNTIYKPGINKVNMKGTLCTGYKAFCSFFDDGYRDAIGVYNGIHVFNTLKDAQKGASGMTIMTGHEMFAVPVYAEAEDLVASGSWEATNASVTNASVFKKITLRKKEYNETIKMA